MMDRRHKLRTEINRCHDPVIRRFPPEIVSNIFESYVEEDTEEDDDEEDAWEITNRCLPLTLGGVCQDWRRIVWSFPQLWTRISINLSRSDDWNCVEIAQECLSRSGQLPLSIQVRCEPFNVITEIVPDTKGVLLGLVSAINRHSNRWANLRLRCSRMIFPLISGNSHGAPMLRGLYLGYTNTLSYGIEFNITGVKPQPRHVAICNIQFKALVIDWGQVTSVHFDAYIPPSECVELLRQAPQLADCYIQCISDPISENENENPTHNIPFVHYKLQSLSIGGYEGPDLGLFLGIFVFPSLTHLSIMDCFGDSDMECLTELITRSSCRLISLNLIAMVYSHEALLGLLRKSPSLLKLELKDCTFLDSNPLDLFRLLANTSTSDTPDSSQHSILPNLHCLRYDDVDKQLRWDTSFGALIADLLGCYGIQGPHRRPLNEIHVQMWGTSGDPIYLEREVVLRIAEALQLGAKLDFRLNGHDVLGMSIAHHQIALHSG